MPASLIAVTILAGQHLAACLVHRDLALDEWQVRASGFVRDAVDPPSAYHDDKRTGYLEEGPAHIVGSVAARIAGLAWRGPRVSNRTR